MPSDMTAAAILIPGNLRPVPGVAGEVFRLGRLASAVARCPRSQSEHREGGPGACLDTSVAECEPRRSGGGAEVQGQRLIWGRGEEVNGRGCVGGRGRAGRRGLANGRGPEGRGCLSRLQPDSVSLGATCGARRQDEDTKGRLRLTLEEGPTRDQKAGGLENGECLWGRVRGRRL